MTDTAMEYLGSADVDRALDGIDVVETAAEVLRLHAAGLVRTPAKAFLQWPAEEGAARTLNMPSWLGRPEGPLVGTKIINGNPANARLGLRRAEGLILLFDPETGHVRTMMQAARISALRTAAVTAVAVEHLNAGPPRTLAVIGAGTLAEVHLEVLVPRLGELRRLVIHDHDPRRAEKLAAHATGAWAGRGIDCSTASGAEEAVAGADVVVTLTTTDEGYIRYDWLKKGSVLVNVSLDDPLPEVFLAADALVIDEWGLITADRRRILGKLHRAGRIAEQDGQGAPALGEGRAVTAHLGEVVAGTRPARTHEHDIVLVNPIGMSAQDVALAAEVAQRAKTLGLGSVLPH
jgi:ornithine cyclodeaminase